jgi:indolepyruvate decarboxylase
MPIAGDSVAGVHLEQAPKPGSDPESLRQALASILERIDAAQRTVVLPAYTIGRYGAHCRT